MKKFLMAMVVGLFVVGGASQAKAVSLTPSAYLPTLGLATVSGSPYAMNPLVYSYNFSTASGTVTENIYKKSDDTYLFTYLIINDNTSGDSISRFNATGFTGLIVDADYVNDSANLLDANPIFVGRNNTGSSVGFTFNDLLAGQTSSLLVIDTNAKYLANRTIGIYGSEDGYSQPVSVLGPAATPEPATVALFGTGVLGLLGFRRKKTV